MTETEQLLHLAALRAAAALDKANAALRALNKASTVAQTLTAIDAVRKAEAAYKAAVKKSTG